MKIAFASSEVYPFAKTGGLADVSGSFPRELAALGHKVKVFMPKYSVIDEKKFKLKHIKSLQGIKIRVAGKICEVNIFKSFLPDSKVEVFFIDYPPYFGREKIYTDDPDEAERFILFSKGVIEALQWMKWKPDIIHCNDWQTGLIPLYVKDNYNWDRMFDNTATLFTIHNIGYQGKFASDVIIKGELRSELFYQTGAIEHDGLVNFLKAGLSFSDIVNTVSENYSRELLEKEFGAGLEYMLNMRKEDFYGILNGVDYTVWNPETDPEIPCHYSEKNFAGKEKNKKSLAEKFGLPYSKEIPIIGIVTRLAIQKGMDILIEGIEKLMELNAQFILLGSGEPEYEELFEDLAKKYPNKFATHIGYENGLSHLIEAGADIFLMPSHYEPCGLNQIYSLKYGTVPVVRKTGGLADTVTDISNDSKNGTGLLFEEYSSDEMLKCIIRGIDLFAKRKIWRKLQRNGMNKDFSIENSAKEYLKVYKLAKKKRAGWHL